MNWKRLAAATVIFVVVAAAVWTYMVKTYEPDLGTSNVIEVNYLDSTSDSSENNQIATLSFEEDGEDLPWASLDISLEIEGVRHGCSFGSQSNSDIVDSKVLPKLSADGFTFTTEIDATNSEDYTYFDLPAQNESNETTFWLKFSTTDIYMAEGVTWKFIDGASLSEVTEIPDSLSNDTDERLQWYEYDFAVHRVNPNDGVYVFQKDSFSFKVKFLTYYNSDDESRFPTMQIAPVGDSDFPALDDPNLVVPSPCKIITKDDDGDYWNHNETIFLVENEINLCDGVCLVSVHVEYETVEVEIKNHRFEIGQ